MNILLVGGGITSAVTGMALRKILPDSNLTMWDKARGVGGRMTTTKCPMNPNCIADLGAQYITTTEEYIKTNEDVYNDLISDGTVELLNCNIIGMKPQGNDKRNFVVPKGFGFLVKHFFQKAQLNQMKFSHHVCSINKVGLKWIVETKTGEKEDFDAVVLTMPVPQLFLLEGTIKSHIDDFIQELHNVKFSSRYVLVLFYFENLNENWGAQYFDNDPIFRYVAIDNIKRNQNDNLCAVVFHTTVKFGAEHVEESIPDIEKILISQSTLLFPYWPEPKATKCHKWRYSQVTNPYPGSPGCLVLSNSPPLIVGGDGFIGSTFDNCIRSAKTITEKLKQTILVSGKL